MSQKQTLLDVGDNDDWKLILMNLLNVLFLFHSFSCLKNWLH